MNIIKIVVWGATIMCKVDKLWNHVLLVKEIIFPFKKKKQQLIVWLAASTLVNIFHLKMSRSFSMISLFPPSFFAHRALFMLGILVKQASRLISVKLLHLFQSFLHICSMHASNPEEKKTNSWDWRNQRSSNFLALFLGRWWSGEHVVIGAYPGHGRYTQT